MELRARNPMVLLALTALVLTIAVLCLGGVGTADAATIIVPDDYTTIQAAIDNAGTGDTIRVYAGTYAETIVVDVDVSIVGNGTSDTMISTVGANIVSLTASGASISKVQVVGGTTAGISISTSDCIVEQVYCQGNTRGIGLYGADDNYIGNSTFTSNSYAGIGVYSGSDRNEFFNATADSNGNFGLDVFTSSTFNMFESCSFDKNANNGVLINGGSDNNTIANSTMDGNTNYGFSLTQSQYTTVFGCSASNNTNNHGMVIYDTISNNLFSELVVDSNGQAGVNIDGDSYSRYDNITITNSGSYGFDVINADNLTFLDCIVKGSIEHGMQIMLSSDLDIIDNDVSKNTYGIYLENCVGCNVGRNMVNQNDGHGIGLQDSGGISGNRIFENHVKANGLIQGGFQAGLTFAAFTIGSGNVIENNEFIGNQKGIVLLANAVTGNDIRGNTIKDSSVFGIENFFNPGPNTFYHNNFINNPTDVQSPNAADVYDNGYPSGGNYWDSYGGSDDYSGPAQNIWGSDGLGDVLHAVGGGVQDNFPIVGIFNDPLDSIAIVDPIDGALVSGLVVAEAIVVSSSVIDVEFYMDGILVGRDTSAPFHLLLDTTTLTEDKVYNLKAIANRRFGIPIDDMVQVTVNNMAMVGSYISVSTVSNTYQPDDRATAIIVLMMPPAFDEIIIHAQYKGSSGTATQIPDMMFAASGRYGFTFWLSSDIAPGTLTLEVDARAYLRGSMVWKATNVTTFVVAGNSYHDEMTTILDTLATVLDEIDGLNATNQAQLAQAVTDIMTEMDDMGTTLSEMWSDYNATESADLATIVSALATMWDGINSSAQLGFDEVLAGLSTTEGNITDELGTLEAYLAGEIHLSQAEIQQSLGIVWTGLNTSFVDLDNAIQTRLDELEGSMADNSTALKEYIGLQTVQLELYMDLINTSLQLRLDEIDLAIAEFRSDATEGLMAIAAFLVGMDENGTAQHEDVMVAIDGTNALIETINSTSLAELRTGLVDLSDDLAGLNTTEASRHAESVNVMIIGLDALSDQVDDGFNDTQDSLLALDKLDTIMAQLDQMSADLEETKEAATEGDQGNILLLLLLIMGIMTICLIIIGMQKVRTMRHVPEPPVEKLEPVAPLVVSARPDEIEVPVDEHFELMMEDPVMNPPSNGPVILDVEEVPEPPAPVPEYPPFQPGQVAMWAEEILGAEGGLAIDEGLDTEADEAEIMDDIPSQPEAYPETYPEPEAYPETYPEPEAYPETYPEPEDYTDEVPEEEVPAPEEASLDEIPEEEVPAPEEAPIDEIPEEEVPAPEEVPADEIPEEEAPAPESPEDEGPDDSGEGEPEAEQKEEEPTGEDWVLEEIN